MERLCHLHTELGLEPDLLTPEPEPRTTAGPASWAGLLTWHACLTCAATPSSSETRPVLSLGNEEGFNAVISELKSSTRED